MNSDAMDSVFDSLFFTFKLNLAGFTFQQNAYFSNSSQSTELLISCPLVLRLMILFYHIIQLYGARQSTRFSLHSF